MLTPTVHPNHSGEALKVCSHTALFAQRSSRAASYALFSSLPGAPRACGLRAFYLGRVLLSALKIKEQECAVNNKMRTQELLLRYRGEDQMRYRGEGQDS